MTGSQNKIAEVMDAMKDLLLYKNEKYGNSALEPAGIFFHGSSESSILIRLDDKLKRIQNNTGEIRINDICDVIGYCTLLLVNKSKKIDVLDEIKKQKD